MTIAIDALRSLIEAVLNGLPESRFFASSVAGARGVRLKRYVVGRIPVGHEHTPKTLQNIWVRRGDIRLSRLVDIPHTIKSAKELKSKSGANSNLFALEEFRNCDLVRFGVKSEAEIIRVLAEACL